MTIDKSGDTDQYLLLLSKEELVAIYQAMRHFYPKHMFKEEEEGRDEMAVANISEYQKLTGQMRHVGLEKVVDEENSRSLRYKQPIR